MFINLLGWQLNPMFGAAAMSLSSFCVVTNALRLNLLNIRSTKHDKKIKSAKPAEMKTIEVKETKTMEKTIKINGMMCPHCEATVKKCLEAFRRSHLQKSATKRARRSFSSMLKFPMPSSRKPSKIRATRS